MKIRNFHTMFLAMLGAFSPAYVSSAEVVDHFQQNSWYLGMECKDAIGVFVDSVQIDFRMTYDVQSTVKEVSSPIGQVYFINPNVEGWDRTVMVFCNEDVFNSIIYSGGGSDYQAMYNKAMSLQK